MRTTAQDVAAVTRRLAEVAGADVREHATALMLNGLATAVDAHAAPAVAAIVRLGARYGGRPTSWVPGRREPLDPLYAAAASATASHAYDFDDTHLETVLHPSAVTMSAALALAAARGVDGARVLDAFVAGCEIQLRIGAAMPGHYENGWHITGTCGAIGAAAAAGIVCGLDTPTLAHCLGIAASSTVGHRSTFGTDVKMLHAAKAAQNGVLAALLAEKGMTSTADAFEGFYAALAPDSYDADRVRGEVGERWELLATTVKPYPCGVVTHPVIEAGERMSGPDLDVAAIEHVRVRCHPLVVELTGVPVPRTSLEARFSTAHAVAVALVTGSLLNDGYAPARLIDPDVVRVRDRVTLTPDDACAREEATVTLYLTGGGRRTAHVAACRGSLRRQLTAEELETKVRRLVEPVLPGRSDALTAAVRALPSAPGVEGLAEVVRP
jgi:2-methylcitrate dehydratase PrpD